MPQYSYALDTTGSLAANKITDERHTIAAVNDRDYNFIIPDFAPYHAGSLKIWIEENNTLLPLVEGVNWNPSLQFAGASLAISRPIFGAISFNDLGFTGQVLIEYQTLGGEYTLAQDKVTEVLANIIYNPRGSTWEEITSLPTMFPPIDHPWNFADMVGMSEVRDALDAIEQAIINKAGGNIDDHVQNFLNPHRVTKNIVGLGNVENYPPATITQGIQGLSNETTLTPLVLRAVLEELGLLQMSDTVKNFIDHIAARNNPHEDTKSQVGLSQVENLSVATMADVLSKRRVRRYVTMDVLQDYLSMHGCKPSDNPDQEFAPKDALLSVYCNDLNRLGVYADGNGGTYEKIIELNSRDCGYQPPVATQFPKQGTVLNLYCVGVDQFGLVTVAHSNSCRNTTRSIAAIRDLRIIQLLARCCPLVVMERLWLKPWPMAMVVVRNNRKLMQHLAETLRQ